MTDIPGYRLGEVLGAGSGGTVHRAVATEDRPGDAVRAGDAVAVKLVPAELLGSGSRWRREARAAARVDHPGVVRVLDTGTDGGLAWIVMDLLSGPDLRDHLAGTDGLPAEEAVALLEQVADAVAALHAAGLVHRDLKPANVVLHDGRPTVVDLGLARTGAGVDALTSLTASHETSWARTAGSSTGGPGTAGTYAWMAPEQWRGEPTTPATDVYALGGLLHSVLTGRPPYPRETLTELAYSVALDDPPRPSLHGSDPRFDGLVARAMAKDPADRYADAAAFRTALTAAAQGAVVDPPATVKAAPAAPAAPAAATPTASPTTAAPATRGRRLLLPVVGAVVLAAVAGAAAAWLLGGDDDRAALEPGTVLVVCAEDASLRPEPGSDEVVEEFAQGTELEVLDDDRNDGRWVKVRAPDGTVGFALTQFSKTEC